MRIQNLHKTYGTSSWFHQQSPNPVLKGISLELFPQETLAVVGESGCGKTTFAKCVMKIENYQQGDIFLHQKELRQIRQKDLARQIQMVFQDPHSSLNPRKKIFQIVTEPLLIFNETKDLRKRAESVLKDVGLSIDALEKYPHMMSGGQKQRVALARALIHRPEVLVCDEPVSALDVSIQAQVLNLLKDLQQKYRLSLLFISHDLSVVRFIAHRVAVFYKGELVELKKTEELFRSPEHPYTRHLLSSMPQFQNQ